MARVRRFAALLTTSVLVLAACGDDGDDGDADDASEQDASETEEPEPVEPAEDDPLLDAVEVSGDFGEEPSVEVDGAVESETTVRRVLSEGDGESLASGVMVDVRYLLADSEGEKVDVLYDAPQPVPFEEQLMPAPMAEGLVDVPVGSRVLVATLMENMIPEGSEPQEGSLPVDPSETVLMVFDLIGQEEVEVEADLGDDMPQLTLYDFGSPDIEVPDTEPPSELVTEVLVEGDGDEVPEDGAVVVHYSGFLWDDGSEFDSSWLQGRPVPLDMGQVVDGMSEALAGQSVGSTLLTIIPPEMGYGDQEQAGIPANSTLVFVVTIEELTDPEQMPGQVPPPPEGSGGPGGSGDSEDSGGSGDSGE